MQVFRGAVIPSVTGRSRSPPPAPPRAGEPHTFLFFSIPTPLIQRLCKEVGGRRRTTAPIKDRGAGDGGIKREQGVVPDSGARGVCIPISCLYAHSRETDVTRVVGYPK